jgi:hypothetical protein
MPVLKVTLGALLMTVILFLFAVRAPAQEAAKEKDPVLTALEARISQFLEGVSLGQTQAAFQELLAGSPLLKKTDALKELIAKTGELESKYGKYRAFEEISARRVGEDLVLLTYLYKCENFPVVWHFCFYRTPTPGETPAKTGAWNVVTVRFDTDLEALGR